MPICPCIVCGCFCATTAELSSRDRDHECENAYDPASYRKSLLASASESYIIYDK